MFDPSSPLTVSPRAAAKVTLFSALPRDFARLGHANPAHHFGQIQRPWLWREGVPALGQAARRAFENERAPRIVQRHAAADGSTKLLIEVDHGDRVEAVHMPRGERVTLCISSQVGCALGCTFCATASMGFQRHLGAHEIVGQVLSAVHALGPRHPGALTLVFMGMGEPLHNLSEVLHAITVLCDPAGLGLSPRRITVSTSGLVPQIETLAEQSPRPLLAISVNATTDEARSRLMPINRRYPLSELRAALERYPVRPRERITVEYVLLAGQNDSREDAQRLAEFCTGFPHQINLIPFNAHESARFTAPSEETVDRFARAILETQRTVVTVRRSRGREIGAACGQLITGEKLKRRSAQAGT